MRAIPPELRRLMTQHGVQGTTAENIGTQLRQQKQQHMAAYLKMILTKLQLPEADTDSHIINTQILLQQLHHKHQNADTQYG